MARSNGPSSGNRCIRRVSDQLNRSAFHTLARAVSEYRPEAGRPDLRRSHPRFDDRNWPHNLKLIEQFDALARANGVAPAQLALAWILARGDHVHAIPGTTAIPHMHENFASADLVIDGEVLDAAGKLICLLYTSPSPRD